MGVTLKKLVQMNDHNRLCYCVFISRDLFIIIYNYTSG